MQIDLTSLAAKDVYGLMIQTIIPRPIAWVLSDNGNDSFNLAPFSYFNGVCSTPPTLSISVGRKRDRTRKDTWRNIEERSHFVVHIAQKGLAEMVSRTAASLEFGESEVTRNNIPLNSEPGWALPRVSSAPVAFLCQRYQIVEIGDGPQGLIIGRITNAFLADDRVAGGALACPAINAKALDPLARLGGDDYAGLGEVFTVARPE